jgi:hypothetical protein
MNIEEKQVVLRKLTASNGKILVSKSLDEKGNPVVKSKEIYLAVGDNAENYKEIDEEQTEEE